MMRAPIIVRGLLLGTVFIVISVVASNLPNYFAWLPAEVLNNHIAQHLDFDNKESDQEAINRIMKKPKRNTSHYKFMNLNTVYCYTMDGSRLLYWDSGQDIMFACNVKTGKDIDPENKRSSKRLTNAIIDSGLNPVSFSGIAVSRNGRLLAIYTIFHMIYVINTETYQRTEYSRLDDISAIYFNKPGTSLILRKCGDTPIQNDQQSYSILPLVPLDSQNNCKTLIEYFRHKGICKNIQ
jgi:hypothetical protein